ncbi:uncharacterized protein N0V89_009495 [Didymosphaeria variabile]|uniref:Uncharacterized protein n=1 Tax=Didymosphaeria variabile TaxID=1932322 RepID=A0A9W8XDH0_9PLEO|nr:uncharacterized protein N0V89_009495 [Didymosphaeria variabile]KAJ4348123.1 hypothetical protein N0V89_009495 [Didymosphaeria variabile]
MADSVDGLWDEAERMAQAAGAADAQIADEYPSPETIERWKRLFGYSSVEAANLITAQRQDAVTRERITDEHWALIEGAEEAAGYDREAYEHRQQLPELFKSNGTTIPVKGQEESLMFGFRMGGLLNSAEKVKEVGKMEGLPNVEDGWSETGPVKFCMVDLKTKRNLEEWLAQWAVLKQ